MCFSKLATHASVMSGGYVHLPGGFFPGKPEGSCSFHCQHPRIRCSGRRCAGSASSAGPASCLWSLQDGNKHASVSAAAANHTRLQPLRKTLPIKLNTHFAIFIWHTHIQEKGMVMFTYDSRCLGLLLGNDWETKITQILQTSLYIQICG